ncbi:GNAT family N-acetyltransferase [Halomonas andesensis]|uniref:GNAT family N-acetyltransferase n=1 Tax=Vreelandella andesensis TaxID=447567 RepID=UPI001ABFDAAE
MGIARSVTDFNYACYLSDLAVNKDYQKSGIGNRLQSLTQEQLGPRYKLTIISSHLISSHLSTSGQLVPWFNRVHT